MVKFVVTSSVFRYSWEQVAMGIWQRYPNPNSKHVLTEDVLSRHIDGDRLVTRRMLTKTNKIPHLFERFVRSDRVLIVEESVVDPKEKTLTTYTRNVEQQKTAGVEEKCVYKVNPDNPSWTLCERSVWVSSRLFGVAGAIEAFVAKRFSSNAIKAAQGFDYVLTALFKSDQLKDHPLTSSSKIKDTARKAAEMAKSKASPMLSKASTS